MFSMTYTTPCEIQGEILVDKLPQSLGNIKDINGNIYNMYGYYTDKDYPNSVIAWLAPLYEMHPYYNDTSTATYRYVTQTWKPYRVRKK